MAPRSATADVEQGPAVIVLDGPQRGRRFPIGSRLLIGRSGRCDLALAEQLVSRTHAEIVVDQGVVTVLDLGSANGTFVNGREVARQELRDGDVLTLGPVSLRVEHQGPRPPSEGEASVVLTDTAVERQGAVAISSEPTTLQTSLASPDTARAGRARERLQALLEVSQNLATLRELETVYPLVVDQILDTVPAERVALFRVASSGELVTRAARNRTDPTAPVEVSRTLLERVRRERVGLLLEDALLDSGLDPSASVIGQQIRALLCVPIEFDGDLLGVLYLDAPGRGGVFSDEDLHFVTGIAGMAAVAIANAVALEQVRTSADALNRAYLSMLAVLANAIEARDAYTIGHTWRVARIAQVMARKLGWPEERVRQIEVGGVLHDIGKIGVPDAILGKQGRLTPEEASTMRRHPEIGARMLGDVPNLRHALPYVLHHHECYDGSGYPHGLAAGTIPEEARLLAVADGFDAMTSTRPYRPGMDPEKALDEIRRCSGTQFDPAVVAALDAAWAAGEIQPFLQ